jgi:hypothetical protein
MSIEDFAAARLLELVVLTLARIPLRRHGATALVRGLA